MNTSDNLQIGLADSESRVMPGTGRAASFGNLLQDLSLYILTGASLFVLLIHRIFPTLACRNGVEAQRFEMLRQKQIAMDISLCCQQRQCLRFDRYTR